MANFDDLRRRAEEQIEGITSADSSDYAAHDLAKIVEDLRIHQVELEIQNQDLREAQQRLEISREQYQVLYDSAPVGYFTLDPAGVILAANLTGAGLLNAARPALLQQSFLTFTDHADRDTVYLHLRRCISTQTGQACEVRLQPKKGDPFIAHLESTPAVDTLKGIPYIRTIVIDITARKQMEAELEQHRHHLEHLVDVRTTELSQANTQLQTEVAERTRAEAVLAESKQRLEQTLAELKAARRREVRQERLAAVGQLAAGIAHDFNNILTVITGHAALLEMETKNFTPNDQDSISSIRQQSERAAQLIRQILDFTRQTIRHPRRVELGDFLHYTRSFLERTIPENISIWLRIEAEPFIIEADPTQLQQLFTNLALNACDAMPEGGLLEFRLAHFKVEPGQPSSCPELTPGRWAYITVTDTGTGIPPAALPHIFEPFFTTKAVGQGTGLGLAQVYGIVQQHEGVITVESEVDVGTTFTIYLPHSRGRAIEPATAPTSEPLTGHGERVLVVEDNPDVLKVINTLLEALHYKTLSTKSGQEALDLYRAASPPIDAVLADLVMPDLDGIGLLHALQADDPQVKVVIMSGYPQQEGIESLLAQGVIEWVQKPPQLNALAEALYRVLHKTSD